jgi:hypothetical protein
MEDSTGRTNRSRAISRHPRAIRAPGFPQGCSRLFLSGRSRRGAARRIGQVHMVVGVAAVRSAWLF